MGGTNSDDRRESLALCIQYSDPGGGGQHSLAGEGTGPRGSQFRRQGEKAWRSVYSVTPPPLAYIRESVLHLPKLVILETKYSK